MNKIIPGFLIVTLALLSSCATSRKITLNPRSQSFAIMPFEEWETYDYATDRVRWALMLAFRKYGYHVNDDKQRWRKLQDLDYRLVNMSVNQAREAGQILGVDYIIYGYGEFKYPQVFTRPYGLTDKREINKSVVINLLDVVSGTIIIRERWQNRQDWGFDHREKDIYALANDFVERLKVLGYVDSPE